MCRYAALIALIIVSSIVVFPQTVPPHSVRAGAVQGQTGTAIMGASVELKQESRASFTVYVQKTKRLLCVDDNDDTCEMLSYLFAADGYELRFAATAAKALELAHAESFDLYVLDNRLPDRHGIELCQDLLLIDPDTPIVMYSGDSYATQHTAALDAGATAYIDKPNIDQLIGTLRNLLIK